MFDTTLPRARRVSRANAAARLVGSAAASACSRPGRSADDLAELADNTEMVMQWSPTVALDLLSESQILEVLETQPPNDRTVALAAALGRRVLSELDATRLLTVWTRIESWVAAQTDKAIVVVAGPTPNTSDDPGCDEAALAMRMGAGAATARVHEARERCGRLRIVGDALASGVLLTRQAGDVVFHLAGVDTDVALDVCARVLPAAGAQTRAEMARAVRKAIVAVDAAGSAKRHRAAKASRSVRIYPQPDGMAALVATMSAVDAETVFRALDAQARRDIAAIAPGGIRPSIDHARSDCFRLWAQDALADPGLPRSQGRRVDIRVTVTLAALLGLTDDPAYLAGYGPIHPDLVRELLPEGKLRRLITDPITGQLLDVGRTTYRPPQALRDLVIARDPVCVIRGCNRPSERCELDHRIPYGVGTTSAENLAPLCKRHHQQKTSGDWKLVKTKWGQLGWITAAGRFYELDTYSADPSIEPPATEDYWPDFDALNGAAVRKLMGTELPPTPEIDCPF